MCLLNQRTPSRPTRQGYYCTNPDGSDFPSRNAAGGAQNVQLGKGGQAGTDGGGLQPGNVRIMVAFDYALSPSFLRRRAPRLRRQCVHG